jgi:hypothetical protein
MRVMLGLSLLIPPQVAALFALLVPTPPESLQLHHQLVFFVVLELLQPLDLPVVPLVLFRIILALALVILVSLKIISAIIADFFLFLFIWFFLVLLHFTLI